jgi:hypothetical protein
VLLTAEEQRWKCYNSFERKDNAFKQKEVLKDEINNIAMRIVKAREAKQQNCAFTDSQWKVPDVEMISKTITEGNRFYNCFAYQKKTGVKFVPPPVGWERGIEGLKEEQRVYGNKNPSAIDTIS